MPAQPPNRIQGVLERIIFFNEENHYTIAEFRPDDGSAKVTIVGTLPGVQCGETLVLSGEWTRHPAHGDQFKVNAFQSELPSTVYGIRKYLGSGLVHGIGKAYAKKIVDRFGLDTLRVISEESARLRDVPGIGPQRAARIKAAWDEQRSLREVMIFMQTYGATVGQCLRLVKRYGSEAKAILQREPYRVAREIDGIGFKTADRIAVNIGFANDSAARLDAGILFALDELQEEGHTAFPEADLVTYAAELLGTSIDLVRQRLTALLERHELAQFTPRQEIPDAQPPVVYMLPVLERAENRIATVLERLMKTPSCLPPIKIDAAVQWAQEKAGFTFGDEQAEAVRRALASKVFVLTGGPGTGKTTILRALVEILRAKKARVHLAAPTGRAAQRLAESTGGFAQTIHRLLKFDPEKGGFTVNADHPLATDFLVVDEASMLDVRLAAALFQAVPSGAHLVLVGDSDQLPSVGAGQVLLDLIRSRAVPVVRLNAIYRQKSWSLIVNVAHAINRGETQLPPMVEDPGEIDPSHDMAFVAARTPEECLARVLALVTRVLPEKFRLDPREDAQVLAPMHKGIVGVGNLNTQLQAALGPGDDEDADVLRAPSGTYRRGDKIIQLRNNYDKGLFNGDIGRVLSVDPEDGTLEADFDGEKQVLDRSDLGDTALAYAISIHKSQGSEYPAVVIPLVKQHFVMLQRNLLYTAVTRGKRRVFIVGDPAAYAMAVRNTDSRQRHTTLADRLRA